MQHTTAATIVAVAATLAGLGIAATAMITGVFVVLAFILALAFIIAGTTAGVAIVERGRPGYTPHAARTVRAAAEPEAA